MIKEGVMIGGRYEIMGRIGTGGMADVYKAKDQKLNRFVAVKVLKPEFREDTTFIRKFKSEAQAAAAELGRLARIGLDEAEVGVRPQWNRD